jgi:Concanavalin A-like lectin/glucanases superfamily
MKVTQINQGKMAVMLALSALAPGLALADVTGPYSVDANTMHLWHLDEVGVPAVDQAHYNYTGAFTVKPDANQPLTSLFGTAAMGSGGYTGFGTALNNGATPNSSGLSALPKANGTSDNADHTFDNPNTHAFTMEAIIKIGFNPASALAAPQEIIAGEGDAGDSSDRSWQFRIEANATPGTTPWKLRFQKVSGFGSPGGSTANYNLDANIPVAGIDALAQDSWYHVAVTYNGNLADPNSLNLFWTKVDPANTVAALIGSGNMNGWLREQDTDFALGNELRDFNGNTEGFVGSIDEVRISDVARTADQFIFTVPEPSAFALLLMGGLAYAPRLRRRS